MKFKVGDMVKPSDACPKELLFLFETGPQPVQQVLESSRTYVVAGFNAFEEDELVKA